MNEELLLILKELIPVRLSLQVFVVYPISKESTRVLLAYKGILLELSQRGSTGEEVG